MNSVRLQLYRLYVIYAKRFIFVAFPLLMFLTSFCAYNDTCL